MPTYAAILPAAGKSSRFKDKAYKKVYAPLDGRAVWLHSAERFLNRDDVSQVILAISPDDREYFDMKFAANVAILGIEVIEGGVERTDTVAKALERVRDDIDFIAVHDAARPCIVDPWIDNIFEAAKKSGAAIPAIAVNNTIKRVKAGAVEETITREGLYAAQTPQVFRRELLMKAYAARRGQIATDDAQLVEWLGEKVTVVEGSPLNLKITTKDDLKLAEAALRALPKPKLGGTGNPFAEDDMWR